MKHLIRFAAWLLEQYAADLLMKINLAKQAQEPTPPVDRIAFHIQRDDGDTLDMEFAETDRAAYAQAAFSFMLSSRGDA